MNLDVGLAALIVNYNSGAFATRCVESLIAEWTREGRARELLQVVVVDNASPEDQSEFLGQMEAMGAEVIRAEDNLGYAAGMNRCYARTRGGPKDVVAILNPDLFFVPGALHVLLDYVLEHPECGAVDPRACIDPLGVLNLPRNLLPTPTDQLRVTLAHMSPAFCRSYSRHRLEKAIPWWSAEGPIEADMLSGCCLFLRREVIDDLDVLMDERYPLYFEDTDLFRRLSKKGYKLIHHGGARVLHHWSRSAGIAGQFQGEPFRRFRVGQRAYFRRFYGALGAWYVGALSYLENKLWPKKWLFRPMHELVDLGAFAEPVEIELPRSCRFLLEGTIDPNWIVAVGILGEGKRWVCPPEAWEWFFDSSYFMRAIDIDTGEVLGAWQFSKTVPGRTWPLDLAELAGHGDRLFGGKAG